VTIEIETELKPNYVQVYCQGVLKSDAMLKDWQRAFRIGVSEGRDAVLIDIRGLQGEPPTVSERYDLGVRIAEHQSQFAKNILIAVVGNEPMIEPERLAENIARNHGAVIGIFTDLVEAVHWIEAEVANVRAREKFLHWNRV